MPYTGNPTTDDGDKIRLLIGDTSTSTGSEIFADGEIDYFNAAKPNVFLSAALAIESIMGSTRGDDLSAGLSSKKVGDLALTFRSGAAQGSYLTLREKIKNLRMEGVRQVKPYAGGISESDKDSAEQDSDWERPAFTVGMHDRTSSSSTSRWR